MGGSLSPASPGWVQGGEGRAWSSRNQDFSTRVDFNRQFDPARDEWRRDLSRRLQPFLVQLTPQALREWRMILQEPDPTIFRYEALQFARNRLRKFPDTSGLILKALVADSGHPEIAQQAKSTLDACAGRAGFGEGFEFALETNFDTGSNLKGIAAMMLAATAFRAVRAWSLPPLLRSTAWSPLSRAWEAKAVAWSLGFGAELSALSLGQRILFDDSPGAWAINALSLGSLHLASATASILLRSGFGGYAPIQRIAERVVPPLFAVQGIFASRKLLEAFDLAPPATHAWSASLLTYFHAAIGGELSRRLIGPSLARWESQSDRIWRRPNWDLRATLSRLGLEVSEPAYGTIGRGRPVQSSMPQAPERSSHIQLSVSIGAEGPSEFTTLAEYFRQRYPSASGKFLTDDILEVIQRIPSDVPHARERLLEAMLNHRNAGTLRQYELALAIEDVFLMDSLNRAVGSLDFALTQLAMVRALSEDHTGIRRTMLGDLFSAFDSPGGLTRAKAEAFLLRLGMNEALDARSMRRASYSSFAQRYQRDSEIRWRRNQQRGYSKEDRELLLQYVHVASIDHVSDPNDIIRIFEDGRNSGKFPIHEIDATLEFAKSYPFSRLALQRLQHIFEAQDTSSKIREIFSAPGSAVEEPNPPLWLKPGADLETMATAIDGGPDTGYFSDLRVARKVASVTQEIWPLLQNPDARNGARDRLIEAFWEFARSGRDFNNLEILNLLEKNADAETSSLTMHWLNQQFDLEVVSEAEFNQQVHTWGDQSPCHHSFFRRARKPEDKDIILIRELPAFDLSTPASQNQAFTELVNRMAGVMHEFEHWRHSSGHFAEAKSHGQALSLKNSHREDRLKSEILAYLAEARWRGLNVDDFYWRSASILGMPLALFLRNVADQSYYGNRP